MTQVNFYTLSQGDAAACLQVACRITEKAVSLGHRVFIRTESEQQARQLDELLWQFKPSSFVPHSLLGGTDPVAVTIAAEAAPADYDDVFINLDGDACQQHRQFARINEIIAADEESLSRGRERYRYYQAQGYKPETHKL